MSLRVRNVGHIVLRVRDLDASLRFYCGILGLSEVARHDFGEGPMAFLSAGDTHHDLALVGSDAVTHGTRLHHFALKIGESRPELVEAKRQLEAAGCAVHMTLDHHVSQGIYVTDPDGNLIELYVDALPARWRDDPTLVANSDPLTL